MARENLVRYLGYAGAAANWLIPIATLQNLVRQKPSEVNPQMSTILAVYSVVFMRWAIAISPANYPLFACHVVNSSAQFATLGKWWLGRHGDS